MTLVSTIICQDGGGFRGPIQSSPKAVACLSV